MVHSSMTSVRGDFDYTSLLLQQYSLHHDLHSFPTRRSSDLRVGPAVGDVLAHRGREDERGLEDHRHLLAERQNIRSEEHTSELQSHVNVVCRLLLEKKNKTAEPERHYHCAPSWVARSAHHQS